MPGNRERKRGNNRPEPAILAAHALPGELPECLSLFHSFVNSLTLGFGILDGKT